MRSTAVAISILLILPLAAAADSMRCGKWIVNETSSAADILEKCGEPQNKDVSQEDVLVRSPTGFVRKLGVTVTERWHYKRSPGALPMVVKVVDGKVVSIQRTE